MEPNYISPGAQLLEQLAKYGPEEQKALLSKASHSTLYTARANQPKAIQDQISQYEHRAFAREAVEEKPWMSIPIAAAIPIYQASKLIGNNARSSPSLGQAGHAYYGVGEGLWAAFNNLLQSQQSHDVTQEGQQPSTHLNALTKYKTK